MGQPGAALLAGAFQAVKRVIVIPEQVAVSKAHEAFDADGRLRDAKVADAVRNVAARVVRIASALRGP